MVKGQLLFVNISCVGFFFAEVQPMTVVGVVGIGQ
jgi:hypothetical protein